MHFHIIHFHRALAHFLHLGTSLRSCIEPSRFHVAFHLFVGLKCSFVHAFCDLTIHFLPDTSIHSRYRYADVIHAFRICVNSTTHFLSPRQVHLRRYPPTHARHFYVYRTVTRPWSRHSMPSMCLRSVWYAFADHQHGHIFAFPHVVLPYRYRYHSIVSRSCSYDTSCSNTSTRVTHSRSRSSWSFLFTFCVDSHFRPQGTSIRSSGLCILSCRSIPAYISFCVPPFLCISSILDPRPQNPFSLVIMDEQTTLFVRFLRTRCFPSF